MKNSAGRGGCYPPRLKAKVDNILRDLQNSSHSTKAETQKHVFLAKPGFKRVSKRFQTPRSRVSEGFLKGFKFLKKGFGRVSKGFPKGF